MLYQLVIYDPSTEKVYISAPHRMSELLEIYKAVSFTDGNCDKLLSIQEYFDGRLV